MGKNDEELNYTRQDLRKATKFVEGDYTGINPRELYRTLKRSLEEIQSESEFKYQTKGNQEQHLNISSEEVGSKTGTVDGRLMAESDWEFIGNGTIEYKPYGPHGALGIVTSALFILVAGLQSVALGVLGILGLLTSGYLYFQTETGKFPIIRRDTIRALISGEVSERTIKGEDESRTDIFANMSVIYAGDTFGKVYTGELDELDWTHRRALVNHVKKSYNRVVREKHRRNVNDGFVGQLKAWADRSVRSHQLAIARLQGRLNSNFDVRTSYTNLLLEQLPASVRDNAESHQNELLDDLEELAEDMEVYVDREGLKQTQ
jgi:hypothetical protein